MNRTIYVRKIDGTTDQPAPIVGMRLVVTLPQV